MKRITIVTLESRDFQEHRNIKPQKRFSFAVKDAERISCETISVVLM